MEKMGGLSSLVDKMPGMGRLPEAAKAQMDDRQTRRMIAIINSMTPNERRYPDLIKGSRKRRIAAGSGVQIQDVNRLMKQHKQMQKMMKKMGMGGGPGGGGRPGKGQKGKKGKKAKKGVGAKGRGLPPGLLDPNGPGSDIPGLPGMPNMPGLPGLPNR